MSTVPLTRREGETSFWLGREIGRAWVKVRLPFALMSVVAQLSGLLGMNGPPDSDYWLSAGLLVVLLLIAVLGRHRRPWFVLNAGIYLASLSLLSSPIGEASLQIPTSWLR